MKEPELDSECSRLLDEIGVGIQTQRFFSPFYYNEGNRLAFDFVWHNKVLDKEFFGVNEQQLVCSKGLWLAGITKNVHDVFLFFSAIEALVFFHLHQYKYDVLNRCIFVALGVRPCIEQIELLKILYKKARVHTVFGNDLIGRIYDCKVSLWLVRKECSFFLNKDQIVLHYTDPSTKRSKKINIERLKFSFSTFYRSHGGRAQLKTHKPNRRFNSFIEYLVVKNLK